MYIENRFNQTFEVSMGGWRVGGVFVSQWKMCVGKLYLNFP